MHGARGRLHHRKASTSSCPREKMSRICNTQYVGVSISSKSSLKFLSERKGVFHPMNLFVRKFLSIADDLLIVAVQNANSSFVCNQPTMPESHNSLSIPFRKTRIFKLNYS